MRYPLTIVLLSILFLGCRSDSLDTYFEKEPIFLRGSFNEWNTNLAFRKHGKSQYAEINLQPGTYEFKVGSSDWGKIDFGLGQENTTELNKEFALIPSGSNMILNLDREFSLVFKISLSKEGNTINLQILEGQLKIK